MRMRGLVAVVVLSLLPAAAGAQERKITFTLDFIALGRHAPWYVPIAKGYYKHEGLDVTVYPLEGHRGPIKNVDRRGADRLLDVRAWSRAARRRGGQEVAVNYQKRLTACSP